MTSLNRRSFLAALAAPFVVQSNVGLIAKPPELTFEWFYFKPGELETAYQRAAFGTIPQYTWNALSPAMKRKLKNHEPAA